MLTNFLIKKWKPTTKLDERYDLMWSYQSDRYGQDLEYLSQYNQVFRWYIQCFFYSYKPLFELVTYAQIS